MRGAQEGSYEGNRVAGPVGGVVGGAVGAGVGGAMGAVKGVFGIPDRGYRRGYRCRGYYNRYGHFRCYRWLMGRQFFSRYPVLKIHHTSTMQTTRKPTVMPRLRPTLTSAIS